MDAHTNHYSRARLVELREALNETKHIARGLTESQEDFSERMATAQARVRAATDDMIACDAIVVLNQDDFVPLLTIGITKKWDGELIVGDDSLQFMAEGFQFENVTNASDD